MELWVSFCCVEVRSNRLEGEDYKRKEHNHVCSCDLAIALEELINPVSSRPSANLVSSLNIHNHIPGSDKL